MNVVATNNKMYEQFNSLKDKNYTLYTMTIKFKYSKQLFNGWEINTDLMYTQINWLFGRVSRDLFYKPKKLDMLWWGGPHYNKSDSIKGVHAHFTVAVKEDCVRSKYRQQNSFSKYLKNKESQFTGCLLGGENLLNSFWLGSWDGGIANIVYNTSGVVDLHDLWLLQTKL